MSTIPTVIFNSAYDLGLWPQSNNSEATTENLVSLCKILLQDHQTLKNQVKYLKDQLQTIIRVDRTQLKQDLIRKENLHKELKKEREVIKKQAEHSKVSEVCEKCINNSLANTKLVDLKRELTAYKRNSAVENSKLQQENANLKDRVNALLKSTSQSSFRAAEIQDAEPLTISNLLPKNLLDLKSVEDFNQALNRDKTQQRDTFEKFLCDIFNKVFSESLDFYNEEMHTKLLRYV